MIETEIKTIETRPTFELPKRLINWRAVRDMIIYDMGGQAGWQPWIMSRSSKSYPNKMVKWPTVLIDETDG